ncbi:hypothetical protein JTB14_023415 [Gonioctena quinquepunctata]|nr:hypothetical protein JTB14_023415 [Gonioctena quinquepunctata]
MAIEHAGVDISTDTIETELLDMETDISSTRSGGTFVTRHSRHNRFDSSNITKKCCDFDKHDWYVDSCGSPDFTPYEKWMKNVYAGIEVEEITVANNRKLPVKCVGDVMLQTVVGNNYYDIPVK